MRAVDARAIQLAMQVSSTLLVYRKALNLLVRVHQEAVQRAAVTTATAHSWSCEGSVSAWLLADKFVDVMSEDGNKYLLLRRVCQGNLLGLQYWQKSHKEGEPNVEQVQT